MSAFSTYNVKKIILIRHGEAENNIQKKFNTKDTTIYPLTEKGCEQAQSLGFNELNLNELDTILIVSSPFRRCRETAEIIASNLTVQPNAMLEDENFGEARMLDQCGNPFVFQFVADMDQIHKETPDARIGLAGNIESGNDLLLRTTLALENACKLAFTTGKNTVIMVGHWHGVRVGNNILAGLPMYEQLNVPNCGAVFFYF
jgi:broad specificity phosphatase PhoE